VCVCVRVREAQCPSACESVKKDATCAVLCARVDTLTQHDNPGAGHGCWTSGISGQVSIQGGFLDIVNPGFGTHTDRKSLKKISDRVLVFTLH
jgi:hypothetical protein